MFLSREICMKLSKYTKIQTYTILYKSRFKQIKFSKYATKNQKRVYPTGAWVFLNFYFAFSIDIIENIISSSPYSPHNATRTLANGRAAYWSRDTFMDQKYSPVNYDGFFSTEFSLIPLEMLMIFSTKEGP